MRSSARTLAASASASGVDGRRDGSTFAARDRDAGDTGAGERFHRFGLLLRVLVGGCLPVDLHFHAILRPQLAGGIFRAGIRSLEHAVRLTLGHHADNDLLLLLRMRCRDTRRAHDDGREQHDRQRDPSIHLPVRHGWPFTLLWRAISSIVAG
jgi:hypothetical protein